MSSVRLADYRPAPYLISRTDLTVRLFEDHAEVEAALAFSPNPASPEQPAETLQLAGVDLQLQHLAIDGEALAAARYQLSDQGLRLLSPPPGPFVLTSRVRIEPHSNTTL